VESEFGVGSEFSLAKQTGISRKRLISGIETAFDL
jgi:hypothetical protein